MRAGRKDILFASFGLAKEGLDIPSLASLFLVSPQKDYAVVTQSIGRIARVEARKMPFVTIMWMISSFARISGNGEEPSNQDIL